MKQYELFNKVYNELVNRFVSARKMKSPDKHEREDAFMSAMIGIEKGNEPYEEFKESFKLVHNIDLSRLLYDSAYNLCKGFK